MTQSTVIFAARCSEHKALTDHTVLDSIGQVCLPWLHTYWRLHERFNVALQGIACDWCGTRGCIDHQS